MNKRIKVLFKILKSFNVKATAENFRETTDEFAQDAKKLLKNKNKK